MAGVTSFNAIFECLKITVSRMCLPNGTIGVFHTFDGVRAGTSQRLLEVLRLSSRRARIPEALKRVYRDRFQVKFSLA